MFYLIIVELKNLMIITKIMKVTIKQRGGGTDPQVMIKKNQAEVLNSANVAAAAEAAKKAAQQTA